VISVYLAISAMIRQPWVYLKLSTGVKIFPLQGTCNFMVQPRGAVGPRILYNNSEHSCSYKTDIHYYLFAIAK